MSKKLLHLFLVLALVFTMLPVVPGKASAAGEAFIFDNLPTAVNAPRITLTGTLNNVSSSGITYTVERMSPDGTTVLEKRDRSSIGITVSSDGTRITVTNLQLFPGYNRITFYGKRGASEVQTILPLIQYIDSPVLYNLAFSGNGQKLLLDPNGITIVPSSYANNVSQSLFTIEGNAPNAREVIVEYGDNESRSGTVREDGTDYFVIPQVKLKKGKNTLKFRVKNDTQTIEVVRDVVYYDDTVTFYNVQMAHSSGATYDPTTRGKFLVPDNTAGNFTVSGYVIVPNDYTTDAAEPMRIEAAYRLAGPGGTANALVPDATDKIVIRFSAEVQNAANMTAAQLQSFLKFYDAAGVELANGDGNPATDTGPLTDTTATWSSSVINGVTVPNSQLTINIGPNDAASNLLSNVARIELQKDVVAAKDANKQIQISTAPNYLKQATLAGSFDDTKPYVTEAYVVGNSAAGSQRGVDPGEKLIIQLQDGTGTTLPASNLAGYSTAQINTMIQVKTDALAPADLGELESAAGSGRYSMRYNATTKQIEITLDSATGLNNAITTLRPEDAGVGNGAAAALQLQQFLTSSGVPIAYQATGSLVRLGGSFDADGRTPNPVPSAIGTYPNFARAIYYDNALTDLGSHSITLSTVAGMTYSDSDPYYIFQFTYNGASIPQPAYTMAFGNQVYVQLQAVNTKKTRLAGGATVYEGTDQTDLEYTLVDSTAPYIQAVKYNDTQAPTGAFATIDGQPQNDLVDGVTLNKMPFAIKLSIPNGGAADGDETITVKSVAPSGTVADATIDPINQPSQVSGTTRDIWFWVTDLPYDGTQTLQIYYKDPDWLTIPNNEVTYTVKITSISGAAVQFNKLTEGMVIQYDPTDSLAQIASSVVGTSLADFKGVLNNVPVNGATDYDGPTQKIFLYVNNNEVKLKTDVTDPKFVIDATKNDEQAVYKLFNQGQNTIRFVYKGNGVTYEKQFKVNLFSINMPEIPKAPSGDIYPYGTDKDKPARDDRFQGSNGAYTTKEAEMNIYGSFDFIDLGSTTGTINAKRASILPGKYILHIDGPNGLSIDWDLKTNQFTDTNNNVYAGSIADGNLSVVYDTTGQYFTFILKNQKLPGDGSKAVYNFYVYNDGVGGNSSASFRLEVGTAGVPYKLLKPYLPQQATINQNYLEVVIWAENADKVVVNKVPAEKFDFDANYDGTIDASDYKDAFRAIVKDLKPNKANKITYTITRGSDTVTDSFEVFYALTAMPGAQVMQTMTSSHKVFDGKLNLTFPKDTYLRRVDYDVPDNLRTQVYKGHSILFAIANSEDGVVDRYDYVNPKPKGFSDLVESLGLRFRSSFDPHFVKASPVYWIDAGLADNPDTTEYDTVPYGILPYQLPYSDLPSFDSVPSNRVVAPTKRGTLELAFDPNIVSGAGNNITVMRYDAEHQLWENLGGQVNVSKHTIKVPFDKFGYYVVAKLNDSFQDVVNHPYARDHVEVMYSKGIIKPKRSNEFGPDDETTRAEFTAMVVRALQLPLVENPSTYSFDDVPTVIDQNSLWDYRYIETAARLGLVRGTNPRIFEPNAHISRQEAAVILARALQLKTETSAAKVNKDLQKLFKDFNLIDPYARPAVLAIAKKKFILGSPIDVNDPKKGYVFEPNANMLRGDAAILMARVMQDLKKIPPVAEVK